LLLLLSPRPPPPPPAARARAVIPIHLDQQFLVNAQAASAGNTTITSSTLMDLTMSNMEIGSPLLW
jgi:hypothetical protein